MSFKPRVMIPLLIAVVALGLLIQVRSILLPFILGGVLAYLLNPLVAFFEVRGLRRRPVVILIFSSFMILTVCLAYVVLTIASREASRAALQMPAYVQKGQGLIEDLKIERPLQQRIIRSPFIRHLLGNKSILEKIERNGRNWPAEVLSAMPGIALLHVLPLLELMIFTPFIAFFLMLEGPALFNWLLNVVPSSYVEVSLNVLVDVDNTLGNYLRGLVLEAFCVGLMAFVGFWLIDLDYALQISIVAGFTNLIPLVGPIMAAVLGSAVAIFQWGTMLGVVKVVLICVGLRLFDDTVLQPFVMRRAVHLHPVAIVFALLAATELWGFWGLLFGVPLACMVKVLIQITWRWYRSQSDHAADHIPQRILQIPLI